MIVNGHCKRCGRDQHPKRKQKFFFHGSEWVMDLIDQDLKDRLMKG